MATEPLAGLRIGALAERVGATETVLRVWERRYGLLAPVRSAGGYRLYGPEDERRARAMVAARERGVPAAQAAAAILAAGRRGAGAPQRGAGDPSGRADRAGVAEAAGWISDLVSATAHFDHVASHQVLDRAFATASVEVVVRDVLMPFLAEIGRGWSEGTVTVEHEHFASDLVRGRLSALGAGLGAGAGPTVLLACLPGERHDLGLKAFDLVALRAGCRTRYLGADTPITSIEGAAARVEPDLVVLAGTRAEVFEDVADHLRDLARHHPVAIAGAGASPELADRLGARLLAGDPVTAARHLRGLVNRTDAGAARGSSDPPGPADPTGSAATTGPGGDDE